MCHEDSPETHMTAYRRQLQTDHAVAVWRARHLLPHNWHQAARSSWVVTWHQLNPDVAGDV